MLTFKVTGALLKYLVLKDPAPFRSNERDVMSTLLKAENYELLILLMLRAADPTVRVRNCRSFYRRYFKITNQACPAFFLGH